MHVRDVGLRGADDHRLWDYASAHGFTIVSKDTDFRERSYVQGFPLKIIWLDVRNADTEAIAELLRREAPRIAIAHFDASTELSMLILSLGASAV
jgi:predicted nuclease of predicted toxin-antitoxin system